MSICEKIDRALTHWGQVTQICIRKLTIIASDSGLLPERRKAIIWTNAGILLIGPLGTNFIETLIESYMFSFKRMHFKLSSGNWRPFCLGLNVLTAPHCIIFLTWWGLVCRVSPARRPPVISYEVTWEQLVSASGSFCVVWISKLAAVGVGRSLLVVDDNSPLKTMNSWTLWSLW